MTRKYIAVAALMIGSGCTWQGTPIPVMGDARMLQGNWEGTYFSRETGRTGSILFQLKAGADSAYGDIVMIPVQAEDAGPARMPQTITTSRKFPQVLRISFVQCGGRDVTGLLDPYQDPDTGEQISTTFVGHLKGDELEGTFSSRYPGGAHRLAGTWVVKRVKN
jgi:hypothetical protein